MLILECSRYKRIYCKKINAILQATLLMICAGGVWPGAELVTVNSKGEKNPVRLAGDCNPWVSKMGIS
jgi:hypothetical protein